ncbi:MAG: trans-sulfuration enzyme family protein [Phycisphaerales bacterium]
MSFASDFDATLAIHAAAEVDPVTGAITGSICQSSTFRQDGVGKNRGFAYSRVSNPTVSALERALGALDGAPQGVAFGTGLAAETTLFLSLLKAGDHVVLGDVIYGGTVRLFQRLLAGLGIEATFVDTSVPANVAAAITARTKLVFIETPANPTLKLADIAAIARITRLAGIPLCVDNTFQTAMLQKPLDLGADIALYSTTKHIEGHNSVVGGAVTSRDEGVLERLRFVRKAIGTIAAPFDAWLTLRGLKTLPVRIAQHSRSAAQVANWLEKQGVVERVYYPGLASFAQRELAERQHVGGLHGGIVTFELVGGLETGTQVMNSVKLCALAESLGSVESLITHPATMTHGDVPREQRLAAGISDGLVRLSVGLEEPADIIADLEQAFAVARGPSLVAV